MPVVPPNDPTPSIVTTAVISVSRVLRLTVAVRGLMQHGQFGTGRRNAF